MLGWRRRKDGFEWREYVRTTILVRRKNRRDRLVRAGAVAVDGIKVAGERGAAAGAVGAQALGRAAKVAGQHGMVVGAAGAQVLGRGAKAAGHQGLRASAVGVRALGRGAKAAGRQVLRVSAAGVQALGRGAKLAGRQGMRVSVAGARAADGALRAGMPKVWAALKAMGRAIAAVLSLLWAALSVVARRLARLIALVGAVGWRAFEPAFSKLREPSVSTPLAVTGGVALLGAGARVAIKGADRDTLLALLIGVVILSVLLVARYSDGAPVWLATPLRAAAHGVRKLVGTLGELRLPSARVLRPVGVVAALALVVGVGWLAWQAAPASLRLMQATREATSVKGRAVALSGDTLRVARTTIRLSGIEAPVPGQTCAATRRRRWHCDAAARVALKRLVRRHVVTCALKGKDRRGRTLGSCQAGQSDLAAELVRNGHVFAETGLFASYRSLERKARAEKAGIWRGEAKRPSDYRAQKWEEAKRDAPDGCPIKGDVKRGRRIYVLPWMRGYERVRIRRSRGERWFCSEAEARQAGWKPSERS